MLPHPGHIIPVTFLNGQPVSQSEKESVFTRYMYTPTHPYDNQEYCTYKRKKQWLAFVLEAVVAFGAGHFYTENYERAIPKLIFWLIGWFLFITMRVISVKREKRDEVALIFAMLSCVMTIGMIVWYAVDVIMIGLNRYEDGNGINFKSWKSDDDY